MAGVLTTASTLACGHGATGSASSSAKLTVSGNKVLTSAGTSGWSFLSASCSQQPVPNTPKSSWVACTKLSSQNGGKSKKLTAGGSAVVLDSIAGDTDGNPLTDVKCQAGQTKLTAS
jgi:hypothetical protein